MKAYMTAWFLLTAMGTGLAQPVGLAASEEAPFSQPTIPQITGQLFHISPQKIRETTITYTLMTVVRQQKYRSLGRVGQETESN